MKSLFLASISAFFASFCTVSTAETPAFPQGIFGTSSPEKIALGQVLFYDPILSGNRNISCATCHHPKFASADGVSLSWGEGGVGLGPDRRMVRDNAPLQRIPRNAPALFNLGAAQFTTMFHDGRVEMSQVSGAMRVPLVGDAPLAVTTILAAQSMFPVLSSDEMAGHFGENAVSRSVHRGLLAQSGGAWDILARRVSEIPRYRAMFDSIIGPRALRYDDIATVLADFIASEWRADNSAFDRALSGETLSNQAARGMDLFYGKAQCVQCHTGRFQTDHLFHAIAMPQIGPGKGTDAEGRFRDIGRALVTGDPADMYRFRTPSLRNVSATGPYGHDGAYATLEAVVRHHLNPVKSLYSYDRTQAILLPISGAPDWEGLDDPVEMAAIAAANELDPIALGDDDVAALIAFLDALSDQDSLRGRLGVPLNVPSGLPVDRN